MIIIAAGSSLPFCGYDSQQIVLRGISALRSVSSEVEISPLYQSPAWPDPNDPPFVNAVARIESTLSPIALLAALHAIEAGFGRRRGVRNAPRTLDLDLIDYNGATRTADKESALELPHPRLGERAFVLAPLSDLAPQWRHPQSGKSAADLLKLLPVIEVERIKD